MGLTFHPRTGTIVVCDYHGLIKPEMVKRRLSVVVSSDSDNDRYGLCTVIPLSTTEPDPIKPYHHLITWDVPFPEPYNSPFHWVKGDMIYAMSFERLSMPFVNKDGKGKRNYVNRYLPENQLKEVQKCILYSIDLSHLTSHF